MAGWTDGWMYTKGYNMTVFQTGIKTHINPTDVVSVDMANICSDILHESWTMYPVVICIQFM